MNVKVSLGAPLADAAGGSTYHEVQGETAEEALRNLCANHPQLARLMWSSTGGGLNPMLAVFHKDENITRTPLAERRLEPGDELSVISALEGG